jgi:hypothetical protein
MVGAARAEVQGRWSYVLPVPVSKRQCAAGSKAFVVPRPWWCIVVGCRGGVSRERLRMSEWKEHEENDGERKTFKAREAWS